VSTLLEHPNEVAHILASALPLQAGYLTNYIMVQGFIAYSMLFLCRFDEFILCKLKQTFHPTKAQHEEDEVPIPFNYSIQYARELLIFTMALTYSSISPFMLPVATIYFAFAYLTMKYNFVFVYNPPYQGIHMTQVTIDQTTMGIFIYQLTMMGIFGLKLFPFGGSVIILVILTFFFRWYIQRVCAKPSKFLPLSKCPKSPPQAEETSTEVKELTPLLRLYLHPALKPLEPSLEKFEEIPDKEQDMIKLDEINT